MKKAIIYYSSRKGTTKYFGEEIGDYLQSKNIETRVISVLDAKPDQLDDTDIIFLGGWTHGLFLLFQHPDKNWIDFVKSIPSLKGKKICLFTTYKIATGSLFKKMGKHLKGKVDHIGLNLKSKNDKLSGQHKAKIDTFLSQE